MFRRLPRRARKVLTVLGVLMVILGGIAAFTGCQSGNSEEKQGEDLEFTVTGEADIPAENSQLLPAASRLRRPYICRGLRRMTMCRRAGSWMT